MNSQFLNRPLRTEVQARADIDRQRVIDRLRTRAICHDLNAEGFEEDDRPYTAKFERAQAQLARDALALIEDTRQTLGAMVAE